MSIKEFGERVCQYVREALPHELEGTDVRIARLDMGDGVTHMVLLVIRPWNGIVTGFCLEDRYKRYASGTTAVESAAAAIINDRRLYNVSME